MSLSVLNPWGFTSVAAAILSLLFAWFLWTRAAPTPVTRRFIALLLIEMVTVLTSSAGVILLLNLDPAHEFVLVLNLIHHVGDFLLLVLYPIFVAYALPLKFLRPLTTRAGRYALYSIGFILCVLFLLTHFRIAKEGYVGELNVPVIDMWLYRVLVIMFVGIFLISLLGVKLAKTKLAKERALAFTCAFGARDLAWATVYLAAASGWYEKAPVLITQLYVGSTLIYIPIVAYGILKLQMLDIEIRLKSTVRNSVLAGLFVVLWYVISEGADILVSGQLGGLIGFTASALLTLLLTPLHRWADRFSSKLVSADVNDAEYPAERSLEVYSAAVELALAHGEITQDRMALLDKLRNNLQLSDDDATRIEQELQLDRAAVAA